MCGKSRKHYPDERSDREPIAALRSNDKARDLIKRDRSEAFSKQCQTKTAAMLLYAIHWSKGSQWRKTRVYLETWTNLGLRPIRRATIRPPIQVYMNIHEPNAYA